MWTSLEQYGWGAPRRTRRVILSLPVDETAKKKTKGISEMTPKRVLNQEHVHRKIKI